MTILFRYLARQNFFLLCVILLAGTGIYLITDLFERIDDFIEAKTSISTLAVFFLSKTPIIISQVLPAVFLMATLIQLNILAKNNELIALQAGGITFKVIIRFILIYGCILACVQLVFSQYIGTHGERYANRLWQEEVRGNEQNTAVQELWFTEKNYIVHLSTADTATKEGTGLVAYELDTTGESIKTIIQAKQFTFETGNWTLSDGKVSIPEDFSSTPFETYTLPLQQNFKAFIMVESSRSPAQLPLWELSTVISRFKEAGSNVEALRVAWHGKIAYALSIVLVGLYALAISQKTQSIYRAVGAGIVITFLYHSMTTFFSAMGERSILDPMVAAWLAFIINLIVALGLLIWPSIRKTT